MINDSIVIVPTLLAAFQVVDNSVDLPITGGAFVITWMQGVATYTGPGSAGFSIDGVPVAAREGNSPDTLVTIGPGLCFIPLQGDTPAVFADAGVTFSFAIGGYFWTDA